VRGKGHQTRITAISRKYFEQQTRRTSGELAHRVRAERGPVAGSGVTRRARRFVANELADDASLIRPTGYPRTAATQ